MGDEGGHDGGSRARTGDPGRRPPHLLLHRHGRHRAQPLANTDRWKGGRKRRTRNERRGTEAIIAGGRLMALLLSVFPGADADPNRGRSLARAGRRKPVGRSEQAAATGFFNSWRLVLEGQERRKRWENRSAATFCQQLGSFATRAGRTMFDFFPRSHSVYVRFPPQRKTGTTSKWFLCFDCAGKLL